jgi:hypothetical protein
VSEPRFKTPRVAIWGPASRLAYKAAALLPHAARPAPPRGSPGPTPDSVGTAVAATELRPDGPDAASGTGELLVRGPS